MPPIRAIDPSLVATLDARTRSALALSASVGHERDVQALTAQIPRLAHAQEALDAIAEVDTDLATLAQPHRFGTAD